MINMSCTYCDKIKDQNFGDVIKETDHWIIFLAPNQSNLGTCVVALNRHCEELSELTKEEWEEFISLVIKLERAVKESFQATLVNWGCLMNSSYLHDPPDPHLHWHFIPRYRNIVKFDGLIFEDPHFGYMKPRPPKDIDRSTRMKIIKKIKESIDK